MLTLLFVALAVAVPLASFAIRMRSVRARRRGGGEESARLGRMAFGLRTGWIALLTLGLLALAAVAAINH